MTRQRAKELQAAFNAFADGKPIMARLSGAGDKWLVLNSSAQDVLWGDNYDFEPAPPLVEGWVNVYPDGEFSRVHHAKVAADCAASDAAYNGLRLRTVFVREVENP
jgi:hypothetical protein